MISLNVTKLNILLPHSYEITLENIILVAQMFRDNFLILLLPIFCYNAQSAPFEASLQITKLLVILPMHVTSTKTCLYNVDPLKPHFYIVKLGFTGVYIIFLISAQKT